MNPSLVLDEIRSKEDISLEEAERGILACLLRAVQKQVEKDEGFLDNHFNTSLSRNDAERFLKSELKDLIYLHEQEEGRLNSTVLKKAVKDLNTRIDLDSWDDNVAEEHRDTCNEILAKT